MRMSIEWEFHCANNFGTELAHSPCHSGVLCQTTPHTYPFPIYRPREKPDCSRGSWGVFSDHSRSEVRNHTFLMPSVSALLWCNNQLMWIKKHQSWARTCLKQKGFHPHAQARLAPIQTHAIVVICNPLPIWTTSGHLKCSNFLVHITLGMSFTVLWK